MSKSSKKPKSYVFNTITADILCPDCEMLIGKWNSEEGFNLDCDRPDERSSLITCECGCRIDLESDEGMRGPIKPPKKAPPYKVAKEKRFFLLCSGDRCTRLPARCRYEDCSAGNLIAANDTERVTCEHCRKRLGLPPL